jgi:CRP-like cAMP-binding protein
MLSDAFAATSEIAVSPTSASPAAAWLCAPLDSNPLADRLSIGKLRSIDAREHLFLEGDKVTHVYRVEAGHVCIYRMVADGRRQVLDFAYPGDMIGLGAGLRHANNAQATAKTRLRCLPINVLHDVVLQDGRLGLKLCEALSQELHAARELLFAVSQRTAAERVAGFLTALVRRNERHHEPSHELVLPMTRSDIADFLGLTIETVSRTFTKFRNDGLIDLEQCILVTILNSEGLEAVASGAGGNHN